MDNNGFDSLFSEIMASDKTPEEIAQAVIELREALAQAPPYLRSGKNYRALTPKGQARINGVVVTCYEAGEKVNSDGKKVEPKPRATAGAGTGRKKKTS